MAIKPRPKKPLQSIAKPELRVSVDLQKLFEQALAADADEVTIRISGYNPDLSPGNFQAIVKFSDRTRAWAVAVHEQPHIAFVDALTQAA